MAYFKTWNAKSTSIIPLTPMGKTSIPAAYRLLSMRVRVRIARTMSRHRAVIPRRAFAEGLWRVSNKRLSMLTTLRDWPQKPHSWTVT